MKRIMLTVSYDGTAYCGWQWQPGVLTVEEALNQELSRLLREDIRVKGASRTDSGVHALGNLCVFDTETRIPPEKICFALNQSLPADIVVQDSCEVPLSFHPRKCGSKKTYEYTIWNSRFPNPVNRRYVSWIHAPLDEKRMQEAAVCLVGEHDFKSFCSPRTEAETTVRRILALSVRREGCCVILRVQGTGFLYNMVRIIAGTLIQVGRGAMPPERVAEILAGSDRALAGPTAPPEGLCLMEISLDEDPWKALKNKEIISEIPAENPPKNA
ncbi:MAG: tRNA pseudouridine(38-40) synthase TruA [Lachnospiraceae bacterium]|nr:tRNA pseudouridine(38-40) synthase TruA [Lachnospiraceae bacterium]